MGKYDDIINLPHHMSKKHPHMTMIERAAQFSPFKAMVGLDEEMKEAEHITEMQADKGNKKGDTK